MRLVPIANMNARCSLRVGHFNEPGYAMSDCCQFEADTGVLMADGSIYWRCHKHQGVRDIRTGELGAVVTEVVHKD